MDKHSGYDHPFIAETYDFVVPYRKRKDVTFFVESAKESEGSILELGCGTGRILIPAARQGISITGLDLSSEMLRVCRNSIQNEPQFVRDRVTLVHGDMRDFSIQDSFQLIMAPFRAFHHLLEISDQTACLDCCYRHMPEGGRLILDLFNPYLPYLFDKRFLGALEEEPSFTLPDGRKMSRCSRLLARDLHKQVLEMEFLYEWKGKKGAVKKQSHQFSMRYFFRYEIEHLLVRSGFTLEAVYADYKKSPFGSKYPGELIVVARK